MSEKNSLMANRLAREQAMAEVLKMIIPQAFSSPQIMSGGAEDSGQIDEWKTTVFESGHEAISMMYFRHRGVNDHVRFYEEFTDHYLRSKHSVDGHGLNMIRDIASFLGSGGGKNKIVKRPNVLARNLWDRDWERRAESEGADVVE